MGYQVMKFITALLLLLVLLATLYWDHLLKIAFIRIDSLKSIKINELIPGENIPINITLVMAYFNLGNITKTTGHHIRTKNHYWKWMEVYQWVRNPMVFYSDDLETLDLMKVIRQNLSDRTEYIHLSPEEPTWALSLLNDIESIFSDPNYPKLSPETVVAKYSCAMHAKYELLVQTVMRNPFLTPYFAWCDVGLLRLVQTEGKYYFSLPPHFDDNRVSYSLVLGMNEQYSQWDIVNGAKLWVAGGFVLGRGHLLISLFEQYKRFTEMFINNKTMASDEQVLYMMYLPSNRPKTTVGLQLYSAQGTCDPWFHLALVCIRHLCAYKTTEFMGETLNTSLS